MNRITKIYQPSLIIPKNSVKNHDITSRSHRLMLEAGLMRHCGNGTFYLLPLLQRSIDKCTKLLDYYMGEIYCQKLELPKLISADLWKKSGRFEVVKSELMLTNDRNQRVQILGPTHEESITYLLSLSAPTTYRSFPLRLYQIATKFRDEMKPRFGLIRAKEFLMKDLYTFDLDLKAAHQTYEEVSAQYSKIFSSLGIPFEKIDADTGTMGGHSSHEYQILTNIGEDEIVKCQSCDRAVNKELCSKNGQICENCNPGKLKTHHGIEIGHTFILEDKYSKIMKATFLNRSGRPENLMMGCYGIGVTRLIAACIEFFSTEDEIRWPYLIAPYQICIISPKTGSKEESEVQHYVTELYHSLNNMLNFNDSIVVDDRESFSIGKRFIDAKKLGYPLIIVVGAKACGNEPKFEIFLTNENQTKDLSYNDLISFINDYTKKYNYKYKQ
ncbi:unnamed protein product [Diamesa serratosioi]